MMRNMQREYTAVFKKSGKWIVAWIEEVPGVNTQGRTMKEARKNLKDAAQLIFSMRKSSKKVKEPDFIRESFTIATR